MKTKRKTTDDGFNDDQLARIARHELCHDYKNKVRAITDEEMSIIGSLVFVYAKARKPGEASWQFYRAITERIGRYNKVHDPVSRIDVWEHFPRSVSDIDAVINWRMAHPRG